MAQYTINSSYGSIFGMDVHARSITVSGFNCTTAETKVRTFRGCPDAATLLAWMDKHFPAPHFAAYESGCTGFHLAKEFRALGVVCEVVAVSSIARSEDDKVHKNDKRDAKRLMYELLSPKKSYSVVWVPDTECEAARNLARLRADVAAALKRAKQQAEALLLRLGHVWCEKTASGNLKKTWGIEYMKWLSTREFESPLDKLVLMSYVRMVEEQTELLRDVERMVVKQAATKRFKPYVDALVLLKGVNTQTAFLLACEFGDFHRFKNGRGVSAWLGTVPSEDSSGEHIVRGRITKAGNSHVQYALVEGIQNIARFSETTTRPKCGYEVTPEVFVHVRAANKRLTSRYHRLRGEEGDLDRGANKAKVAIASELVRWVWAIGCMVQDEQAACAATS